MNESTRDKLIHWGWLAREGHELTWRDHCNGKGIYYQPPYQPRRRPFTWIEFVREEASE